MPNYPVSNDQAYLICDTTQRKDPSIIVLRAMDATPIYWSQERSALEGNLDSGGNPRNAMLMLSTDPPLIFNSAKMIVWARSTAPTFMSCEILEQRQEVQTVVPRNRGPHVSYTGAAPAANPTRTGTFRLPGFEISWTRKGGVQ